MKKKIVGVAVATAMVAALAAGCGNSSSSDSSASSGSSAASSASASSAASSVSEASSASSASSASTAEASSASSTSSASGELLDECEDNYLIEHLDEYLGDESAEGKNVGMTVQSLGNDFMVYLTDGIKSAFEEKGVNIQIDSCDGDSNTQVEQVENYITMGMDLIIVFPLNGDSMITVMEQAEDQGIPTIAFAMDVNSDKLTSHMISAEEGVMGSACSEMASDWINENFADAGDGEVNVLLIGSTTSPEMSERTDGMESTIQENSKVTLTRQDTPDSNSTDEGRNTAENMFLGNSYDVVIAANATTALGVDSYVMSSDSPVEDLSKFAIFTVDETDEIDAKIVSSENNESAIRGTISMGDIQHTVDGLIATSMPILTNGHPVEHVNGAAIPLTPETLAEN